MRQQQQARRLDRVVGRELVEHNGKTLADVRRFPGSRRLPQYNLESLDAGLGRLGISYRHFEALGGRRSRRDPGSPNSGWRVEAFNAYADHMTTPEFLSSLADLIGQAGRVPTAIMCSEAVPWRCHRRLIADALSVRGWTVLDIMGPGKADPHRLTPFARVVGETLTYPAPPELPGLGQHDW